MYAAEHDVADVQFNRWDEMRWNFVFGRWVEKGQFKKLTEKHAETSVVI